MQMKRVLDFLAEDLFLLSVLDVKIIDRGLFFNHLRPGASTGRLAAVLFDMSDGRRSACSCLSLYQ